MDKKCTREQALCYLENLVGQSLCYGIKSHDTELYDFGFGETKWIVDGRKRTKCINLHNLHILCDFKVIFRTENRGHKVYRSNTNHIEFEADIQNLIGFSVKRVALSDKNDLWLDFESCWVVFITHEDSEESWRYFMWGEEKPHLVVADSWQEFVW